MAPAQSVRREFPAQDLAIASSEKKLAGFKGPIE